MNPTIAKLAGGLIVSCQAANDSPLNHPAVISAFAKVAELSGAVGVRIDGPKNIRAVRRQIHLPIIGIYKITHPSYEVYITPTFEAAKEVIASGADIVALDATNRPRPKDQPLRTLIARIKRELKVPVMADVSTEAEGLQAEAYGADVVATTLCGHTEETRHVRLPALELVARLAAGLNIPVICEGGITTPEEARKAIEAGAYAVVVGTAITNVAGQVGRFVEALKRHRG